MLKLKLQYFGHLMWRADSFEKTLMLGKIEGRRRRGWQRLRWLDGITDNGHGFGWTLGVGDGQGGLVCCSSWSCKESDLTELNWTAFLKLDRVVFVLFLKEVSFIYLTACLVGSEFPDQGIESGAKKHGVLTNGPGNSYGPCHFECTNSPHFKLWL